MKTKALILGMPMTPVERVAGAIFRAATDPDPATSGCPWVLPDDGPVLLLKKEILHEGVYEMLNNRVARIQRYFFSPCFKVTTAPATRRSDGLTGFPSFSSTLTFWSVVFRDLVRLLCPLLILGVVVGLATASVLKSRL